MRKIFALAAAAAALTVSAPAAASVTIDFTATGFSDTCTPFAQMYVNCTPGAPTYESLAGSFSYDFNAATNVVTLTAFSLDVGSMHYGLSNVGAVLVGGVGGNLRIYYGQNAVIEAGNDLQFDLVGFNPFTGLSGGESFYYSTPQHLTAFHTGQVDTVSSAAVPEPATWAMMLLGFGGIGFAMRRRRTGLQPLLAP